MVGLVVFLPEGIRKLAFPEILGAGRFTNIGIPYPEVMGRGRVRHAHYFGLLTRLAAIPLIVIMVVAIRSAVARGPIAEAKMNIVAGQPCLSRFGETLTELPPTRGSGRSV
jgi:hypothetical protein